jgi:hypothetical protein
MPAFPPPPSVKGEKREQGAGKDTRPTGGFADFSAGLVGVDSRRLGDVLDRGRLELIQDKD